MKTQSVQQILGDLGYDVQIWNMFGYGNYLQVTILEPGPSHGATLYIPLKSDLDAALRLIEGKKQAFREAEGKTLLVLGK